MSAPKLGKFNEAVQVALAEFRSSLMRSLLSISGIVIGIASVTTILILGAGIQAYFFERFTFQDSNLYSIYANYNETSQSMGKLEWEDAARLEALPSIKTVAAASVNERNVRSTQTQLQAPVLGVNDGYVLTRAPSLREGRSFLPADRAEYARVCLLSQPLARALFPEGSAVGKTVWAEEIPLEIIGVYDAVRQPGRKNPIPAKRELMIPVETLLRAFKDAAFQELEAHVRQDAQGKPAQDILKALSRGDPSHEGFYRVDDFSSEKEAGKKAGMMLTIAGAVIAMISLIVGGIGVMNVMLTSVTERTREIGLRRALGARKIDILMQFLVESSLLCGLGGLLGFFGGIGLAKLLIGTMAQSTKVALTLTIPPVLLPLDLLSAAILGVLFGLYPASKASRLSPAEALRTE